MSNALFPQGRWAWLHGPEVPFFLTGATYLQGHWSWGLVLAWHYEKHTLEHLTYLVGNVWHWDPFHGEWFAEEMCREICDDLPQSQHWMVHWIWPLQAP